jgi:hypothetical protein
VLYVATTGKGYVHYGLFADLFWRPMYEALVNYFDDPSVGIVRTATGCEVYCKSEGA